MLISLCLLISAIVFVASTVQGMTGFGFGMIVMAVLPFLLPLSTAAIIVSFVVFFVSILMSWKLRENLELRIVALPLGAAIVTVPVGVHLLSTIDETILKMLLGSVIIVLSLFFLFNKNETVTIEPTAGNAIMAGTLSGIMTGMFNIGGPPIVFYFVQAAPDNLTYKASLEFIYLLTSFVRIVSHFAYDNVAWNDFVYVIEAIGAGAAGGFLGLSVLRRVNQNLLKRMVYGVMLVAGLTLILSS